MKFLSVLQLVVSVALICYSVFTPGEQFVALLIGALLLGRYLGSAYIWWVLREGRKRNLLDLKPGTALKGKS